MRLPPQLPPIHPFLHFASSSVTGAVGPLCGAVVKGEYIYSPEGTVDPCPSGINLEARFLMIIFFSIDVVLGAAIYFQVSAGYDRGHNQS